MGSFVPSTVQKSEGEKGRGRERYGGLWLTSNLVQGYGDVCLRVINGLGPDLRLAGIYLIDIGLVLT